MAMNFAVWVLVFVGIAYGSTPSTIAGRCISGRLWQYWVLPFSRYIVAATGLEKTSRRRSSMFFLDSAGHFYVFGLTFYSLCVFGRIPVRILAHAMLVAASLSTVCYLYLCCYFVGWF